MSQATAPRAIGHSDDADIVRRALARDGEAFRTIMRRHNRRLYRIGRSILRDDSEAEDAVPETYVNAFARLDRFRGDFSLATWLSRIAINEALSRLRRERPTTNLGKFETRRHEAQVIQFPQTGASDDPARTIAQREILQLVERATDNLPVA